MIQIKDAKVRKAGSTVLSRTLEGKKHDRSKKERVTIEKIRFLTKASIRATRGIVLFPLESRVRRVRCEREGSFYFLTWKGGVSLFQLAKNIPHFKKKMFKVLCPIV